MTQEEIDALPDELTITLKTPIALGDKTYETLTFREPTQGQIEEAVVTGKTELEQARLALAAMAGVPPHVIKSLPFRKFQQAAAFWQSFTQDAQPTGGSA